jgi:predicted aconitase with swiveling domain
MLELLRLGTAPAALLLGSSDAILVLGVLVAGELGHPTIPVVELSKSDLSAIPDDTEIIVNEGGVVTWDL